MADTLGKQILHNRKRMGLTQDQLADKLGVTAQAVSKWENDQSCPDISMLPRLANMFDISTDELLGVERTVVAEVVETPDEDTEGGNLWELHWDSGRRHALVWAGTVLLVGVLTLLSNLLDWGVSFWEILWPAAIIMVGLLVSRFSFFQLGCVAVGGYFLLDNLHVLPGKLSSEILFPGLVILFGVALFADAVRKPEKGKFRISRKGGNGKRKSNHDTHDGRFTYSASFGEAIQDVRISRLAGGKADISFGDFALDLSGVESVAEGCTLDLSCSFGELTLLIPKRYSVRLDSSTAFGEVAVDGEPDGENTGTIFVNASANFGEICVKYI